MTDERKLAEYLLLIKKQVNYEIQNEEHISFKDDVVNDVFLKLYKGGFFEKYKLEDKEQCLIATSYIKQAAKSCYLDFLKKAKLIRSLSIKEREELNKKYEKIGSPEDIGEHESLESSNFYSSEEILMAKQAYRIIRVCFDGAIKTISHQLKESFLTAAFWEQEVYALPIKKLAEILGYENSNPTQDFNRFVQKVSECTQVSGIKVVNPSEQVEFLKQIIEMDGVTA